MAPEGHGLYALVVALVRELLRGVTGAELHRILALRSVAPAVPLMGELEEEVLEDLCGKGDVAEVQEPPSQPPNIIYPAC